jgi:hypothetical protein
VFVFKYWFLVNLRCQQQLTRLSSRNSRAKLKIWRNVDAAGTEYNAIAPGMVDAKAVRRKLSKQLKIELEPHEKVHVIKEQVNHSELRDKQLELLMKDLGDRDTPCTTQIKHLGEYVARISLQGGYSIPLKIEVLKR